MITALLVDDEPRMSARLAEMLTGYEDIEVIGTARSVVDARLFLGVREPDVVFLDVSMPGAPGVELLPHVEPKTKVVFVTATEDAAVAAFEHGAIDYVLKPFSSERLERAVERLRLARCASEAQTKADTCVGEAGTPLSACGEPDSLGMLQIDSKLPLLAVGSHRVELITVGDIGWIIAQENYTRVRSASGSTVTVRRKLSEWESMLPCEAFRRLDRSLIVNIQRLVATQTRSREQTLLSFSGFDEPLPIGRTASARLKEVLRV